MTLTGTIFQFYEAWTLQLQVSTVQKQEKFVIIIPPLHDSIMLALASYTYRLHVTVTAYVPTSVINLNIQNFPS